MEVVGIGVGVNGILILHGVVKVGTTIITKMGVGTMMKEIMVAMVDGEALGEEGGEGTEEQGIFSGGEGVEGEIIREDGVEEVIFNEEGVGEVHHGEEAGVLKVGVDGTASNNLFFHVLAI